MKKYLKVIILTFILLNPLTTNALTKTETVYSILDSNGSVKSTKINTQISDLVEGEVMDYTKLDDIKNINGEEKFSRESDKLVWKSTGKDIYYQGKVNSELPISVSVKYYLDGKEVNRDSLKGKKGSIKVVYTFINNSYDKNTSMYTPFVVSLISPMSGKNYSNLTVDTGRVIKTGNNNIVVGIAAPGLYHDLPIEELSSMDRIIINYDTTKYEDNEVYFAITPKVLDKLDISMFDKLGSLNGDMNKLQDGVNQLASGSKQLNSGINAYTDGVSQVNDGSGKVLKGMESALDGAKKLEKGNSDVDSNLKQIIAGLKQGEAEIKEKSEELNTKIEEINTLKENNTAAITQLTNANSLIVQGVLEQTGGQVNISEYTYDELSSLLDYLISQGQMTEEGKESILNYKKSYDGNVGLITLLTANNSTIDLLVSTLVSTSSSITEKLGEIDNYLTQLETYGTSQTSSGSKALRSGIEELYAGSNQLFDSINTLNSQSSLLTNGSNLLSNGIDKLNNEGINKLVSIAKKISDKTDTVKTLTKLSKDYNGFGSQNANNTMFIYKIKK